MDPSCIEHPPAPHPCDDARRESPRPARGAGGLLMLVPKSRSTGPHGIIDRAFVRLLAKLSAEGDDPAGDAIE